MSERYGLSRDPERDYHDASEFGFGPGPVPRGTETTQPSPGRCVPSEGPSRRTHPQRDRDSMAACRPATRIPWRARRLTHP